VLLRHLQHRLGAAHVGLLVGHRRLDGGAHARPGRQVDNRVHTPGVEGVQDGVGVADVCLDERKPLPRKVLDSLFLHRARVERIEVIDGRDAVAVIQEAAAEVPADEAGPAGNADMHSISRVSVRNFSNRVSEPPQKCYRSSEYTHSWILSGKTRTSREEIFRAFNLGESVPYPNRILASLPIRPSEERLATIPWNRK